MNPHATAEALARGGYTVHPLCALAAHKHGEHACGSPGKVPLLARWQHARRPSATQRRRWWDRADPPGVGIRTGDGLLVVDADGAEGLAAVARLWREHDADPPPPTVETGGGGAHWYLRVEGPTPRNTAGRLAPHIDTRGDGGQVVAPPSPHRSGRPYAWADGLPPALQALPAAPDWLLAALVEAAPVAAAPAPLPLDAIADAGARALWRAALADWQPGNRNDSANRAAFLAGRLAAAGRADGAALLAELRAHAIAAGLPEREVAGILRADGGYADGQAQPLHDRPRLATRRRARMLSEPLPDRRAVVAQGWRERSEAWAAKFRPRPPRPIPERARPADIAPTPPDAAPTLPDAAPAPCDEAPPPTDADAPAEAPTDDESPTADDLRAVPPDGWALHYYADDGTWRDADGRTVAAAPRGGRAGATLAETEPPGPK